MPFTNQSLSALKPKAQRYEAQEPGGLGVRIAPSGHKSFFFRYRFQRRPRRMALGSFPELSLKEARERRDDARKLLHKGVDPGEQAIQKRMHEIEAGTVAELIDEYISKWAKRHKKSWKEDERILKKEALPRWGNRKAKEITRRDVIRLLDRIVDRGSPTSANLTFEIIRRMFRFAVEQDIIEVTPCYAVRPPSKNNKRDRVLSDNEIRLFWSNADKTDAGRSIQLALKLQLVTAQRRGEIAAAEWAEIDMESAWWTLIFPAMFLTVTLYCFNYIGDGLRDALDPKDRL